MPAPSQPSMRRFGDYDALRNNIYDGAFQAVQSLPPIENSRYKIQFADLGYAGPAVPTLEDHKKALVEGRSLSRRLTGNVMMTDKASGTVVDARRMTLASVPTLTHQGVFVVDGTAMPVSSQFRLMPGLFARRKGNNTLESHLNLYPGTGVPHRISLDPETGVFKTNVGQAEIPTISLLKILGATPDEIKSAWGEELYLRNNKADKPHHVDRYWEKMGPPGPVADGVDKRAVLADRISKYPIDPWVAQRTLGKPYDKYGKEPLLITTRKLLDIARGKAEPDDRDDPIYSTVWGPEHLLSERLSRSGPLLAKMLWQATNTGGLKRVQPGFLTPSIRALFTKSGLALVPEGTSAAEFVDHGARITKVGEGGIGKSADSVPGSSREVHPRQFGFIDTVRASECFDADTEVMTYTGWKRWPDVTKSDRLACLLDDTITFELPLKLHVSDYDGELYGAKNRYINYLVTPDHRFWSSLYDSPKSQVWRWRTASELHNRTEMHRVAGYKPYTGDTAFTDFALPMVEADVPELLGQSRDASRRYVGVARVQNRETVPIAAFAALLGWYLGEGSTQDRRTRSGPYYATRISQCKTANPEKCEMIRQLLTELGITWTYQPSTRAFMFCGKQWVKYFSQFGYSGDRYIPEEFFSAPVEARQRLYDTLLLGEGTKNRYGAILAFNTTSPQLAVDFARLAFSLGHSTSTSVHPDNRQAHYRDVYVVTIHTRDRRLVQGTKMRLGKIRPGDHYTTHYVGKVYCATVPGGMLYVRRGDSSGMWTGNSESIGVDLRVAFGTRLGTDRRLYAPLKDAKTGKIVFRSFQDTAGKVIGFPSALTSKEPVVPVIKDGRMTYAPKAEIDFVLPTMEQGFSPTSNLVPLKSAAKAHRASMASRMSTQALPLVHTEAPLVRTQVPNQPGKSFEELYGRHMGAVFADPKLSGTVTEVAPGHIKVRYVDGTEQTHERYNNLPAGRTSGYHTEPLVKAGDTVAPGQILAKSNHTDDKGHAAYGANLRIGFLNYGNNAYEDAIVISESAAKRLTSDHLYRHDVYADADVMVGKHAHAAAFPGKHTLDVLKTVDDNGVVKPGTVVQPGDPLVLAVRRRQNLFGRLSRSGKSGLSDASEIWDHDTPGQVTDTYQTKNGPVVLVKTQSPVKVGDKLCYDPLTEILTSTGWKRVADVTTEDMVASLDPTTDMIEYVSPVAVQSYDHTGRMYRLASTQYDLLVTDNHKLYVDHRCAGGGYKGKYELVEASKVYSKRFRMKRNGNWIGITPTYVTLAGTVVPAGQGGRGTREIPSLDVPIQTYAMLLGMFISEGNIISIPSSGTYGFEITQTKQPHRRVMLDALDSAGVKYTTVSNGSKVRIHGLLWCNHLEQFGRRSSDKRLPSFVFAWDSDALRILFKWLVWGDGTAVDGRVSSYFTTSPGLADDVQRVAFHLGMSANIELLRPAGVQVIKGRSYNCKAFYRVGVYTTKNTPEVNHSHVTKQKAFVEQWVDYTGKVHCVTLSRNHVMYVRRNGKPIWCGNSGRHGNKGVVVLKPDHEMPHGEDGKPLEVVISSLGVISRANPNSKYEALLGKIATKTGKPYVVNDWDDTGSDHDVGAWVRSELARHGEKAKETLTDPLTGRKIPNVLTGTLYMMKLHHMASKKVKGRGLGGYDESGQPLRGQSGKAMRASLGDTNALLSHGGTSTIFDDHMYRGQNNPDFWLQYMSGYHPTRPVTSLPFQRFLTELQAAGIDPVSRDGKYHLTALTDKKVHELAGGRIVENGETLDFARNGVPVKGGLFDDRIFGNTDSTSAWAKIPLHEPVLNPIFEEPARRLLGLTEKKFRDIVAGKEQLAGSTGMKAITDSLGRIDVKKELVTTRRQAESSRKTARDDAFRKLFYLKGLERTGQSPKDWTLTAVPVLPPGFRPVSAGGPGGSTIVHDSNLLYADVIGANHALRDLSTEVDDVGAERLNLYDAVKAVAGLGDPVGAKNRERGVQGVLGRLLGDGAKFSFMQQKLLGTPVNLSGRGQVIPNPDLDLDQIGIPESMAKDVYHPFIIRRLVRGGMARADAAREVESWGSRAQKALADEMAARPVRATRYPALHRYNVMAFNPVLVKGDAIQTNHLINKGFMLDHDGDDQNGTVIVCIDTVRFAAMIAERPTFWGCRDMTARFRVTVPVTAADRVYCVRLDDFPRGEFKGTRGHIDFYDVPPGIRVVAYDAPTKKLVLAEVTGWSVHKDREVETVELTSGRQIVTDDDPRAVYAIDPESLTMTRARPADAIGLMVPRAVDCDVVVGGQTHVSFSGNPTFPTLMLDPALGYLCGLYAGNGWFDFIDGAYRKINLATSDANVHAAYQTRFAAVFGQTPHITVTTREVGVSGFGASRKLVISNTEVAKTLGPLFGVGGARAKQLPPFFLSGDHAFRKAILEGLLDTDGSVAICGSGEKKQLTVNYSTTSLRLAQEIQHLCRSLGVNATLSATQTPTGDPFWLVNMSSIDLLRLAPKITHQGKAASWATAPAPNPDASATSANNMVPFPSSLADAIRAVVPRKVLGPLYVTTSTAKAASRMARRKAEQIIALVGDKLSSPLWEAFKTIVSDQTVAWDAVKSRTKTGIRETGYDLTVPGFETFMSVDGVILSNTMTINVPLSDDAVKEAYDKLLPSKNLVSPASFKATNYLPNMEIQQGLHYSSTADNGNPSIEFKTRADAIAAYLSNPEQFSMGTRVRILDEER